MENQHFLLRLPDDISDTYKLVYYMANYAIFLSLPGEKSGILS